MALISAALTTFDEVCGDLNLKDAEQQPAVERIINAVSQAMSRAAGGRAFHRQTNLIERHKGYGGYKLVLNNTPIVQINSVVIKDIDASTLFTYDSDDFELGDVDVGILHNPGGWVWTAEPGNNIRSQLQASTERSAIEVDYDCGWITPQQDADGVGTRDLPYELEEACIWSVVSIYRGKGGDRRISDKSNSDVATSYRESFGKGILLPETADIAKAYWRSIE